MSNLLEGMREALQAKPRQSVPRRKLANIVPAILGAAIGTGLGAAVIEWPNVFPAIIIGLAIIGVISRRWG